MFNIVKQSIVRLISHSRSGKDLKDDKDIMETFYRHEKSKMKEPRFIIALRLWLIVTHWSLLLGCTDG